MIMIGPLRDLDRPAGRSLELVERIEIQRTKCRQGKVQADCGTYRQCCSGAKEGSRRTVRLGGDTPQPASHSHAAKGRRLYIESVRPTTQRGVESCTVTLKSESASRHVAWMHKIVTEEIQPKQHLSLQMTLLRNLV